MRKSGGLRRGRKEPGFVAQRGCSLHAAALEEQGEAALCPYPGEAEEVAVLEYSRYRVLCVIAVGEGLFVKQE